MATDAHFRDLDFDVVIADEAGQIQVHDLLVPLVRGRTAVLVGDHMQLPPFVDKEVHDAIQEDAPESVHLLDKSLFEIIYDKTPETNKVRLAEQYRMPAVIAEFIAAQFYQGGLYDGGPPRTWPPGSLLRRPPVFRRYPEPVPVD